MTYSVPFVYVVPEVDPTLQLNRPSSLKVSLSILSVPVSSMVKRPREVALWLGKRKDATVSPPVGPMYQFTVAVFGKVCAHGILSGLPTTPSTSLADVGRKAGRKEPVRNCPYK